MGSICLIKIEYMTVFLTGATGFVGKNVLEKLLMKNLKVRVLVRNDKKIQKFIQSFSPKNYLKNLEIVYGDATKPETYEKYIEGVDTFINLIGIIREFPGKGITFNKYHFEITKNFVDISLNYGVKRFIQMSALGASGTTDSKYYITKYKAERYVIESFDKWVILRPSLIIGPDGEFTKMLVAMVKLGVVPVVGDGNYILRPISITTLSNFISYITTETNITKKEFNLVGPKEYTYNELVDTIAKVLGKSNYRLLHIPVPIVKFFASIFGKFKFFPITSDQIKMLLSGNTFYYDILEKLPINNIPIEEEIKKMRYR